MSVLLSRLQNRPRPGIPVNLLSPGARDIKLFIPMTEGGGFGIRDIIKNKELSFTNWNKDIWIGSSSGGAVQFNGTDQYLSLSATDVPDVSDHFTLYVKMMVRSKAPWDTFIGRASDTNWNNGYALHYSNTGDFRYYVGHYSDHYSAVSESDVPDDKWHHFFGVLNKDSVKLFVLNSDGILIEGSEDTYDGDTLNAGDLDVGGHLGGWGARADCCVEEVGLFDRAFTPDNIREFLYDRTSLFAQPRNLFVSVGVPETGLLTVGVNAGLTIAGLAGGLGILSVGADAADTVAAQAAAAGTLTAAADAGETLAALAATAGTLIAAAQAGESMTALAAAVADMDAAATAGEVMAALAAASAAIVAGTDAGDTWTVGEIGQLTVGAQAGESISAIAAAAAEMDAGATASEIISALADASATVIGGSSAGDAWTVGEIGQLTVGAQAGEAFVAAAMAYGALTGAVTTSEAISATAAALASLTVSADAGDEFRPDSSAEENISLRGIIQLQAALRGLPSIKPH